MSDNLKLGLLLAAGWLVFAFFAWEILPLLHAIVTGGSPNVAPRI